MISATKRKPEQPTPHQLEALQKAAADGRRLVRMTGGFWTVDSLVRSDGHLPLWAAGTLTVRACERRGWLRRAESTYRVSVLTPEGEAVVSAAATQRIGL